LKQLLLVGGGHAHVEVLRQFVQAPLHNASITLVSPDAHTPYSGMLPGLVAGHYTHDQCHVALAPLAHAAGARFVAARVTGLDRAARVAITSTGARLPYDIVSLDVGSTPFLRACATTRSWPSRWKCFWKVGNVYKRFSGKGRCDI
jgi:selenide, water dikinase